MSAMRRSLLSGEQNTVLNPGVAEKVHIDLGVEIVEFVFGEVDAEIVRAVFEETEEVFGAVAGDGRVVGCACGLGSACGCALD